MFEKILQSFQIQPPIKEYVFHPERKWRFDYAWPEQKIALEVEGGVFGYTDKHGVKKSKGAHSSVKGMLKDMEKYNSAGKLGWRVFRVIPDDLMKMKTIDLIKEVLTTK